VAESAPKLVEELIPNVINIGGVQKVLQRLLTERVSIRDLHTILEATADYAPLTKDFTRLTEYVRVALGRSIVQPYLSAKKELSVISLNPELEKAIGSAVVREEAGSYLAMEPKEAQQFLEKLRNAIEAAVFPVQPILLVGSEIRSHVRRLTERFIPGLVVLSHSEIPPGVNLVSIGVVS